MTFPPNIPPKYRPLATLAHQKGLGFRFNDDNTFSFLYPSGRRIGRYSDINNALRFLEKQPNVRR